MGGLSAEAQSARCIRQPSFNLEGGAELSCHMEGGSNRQATKSQGVTTVLRQGVSCQQLAYMLQWLRALAHPFASTHAAP